MRWASIVVTSPATAWAASSRCSSRSTILERLASLTLLDNAGVAGTGVSDLQRSIKQGSNPLELKTMADVDRLLAFVYRKPPFMPRQFKRVMLDDALANAQVLEKVFWTLAKEGIAGVLNARLGEVQVPTLIVWGRHDQLIDVSVVDELRAALRTASR